jgi:hypothetical protein
MRRALFAMLITLLLLRGWTGDAMATQMALAGAVPVASATHQTAAGHHEHHAAEAAHGAASTTAVLSAHEDCNYHGSPTDTAHEANCPTCTVCQSCHTVAITLPPLDVAAMAHPASRPRAGTPRFASADRAQALKPPRA